MKQLTSIGLPACDVHVEVVARRDSTLLCGLIPVTVQVQPDMEELTENAEDIAEEGDSKQSEVKLGKLQYKVSIVTG